MNKVKYRKNKIQKQQQKDFAHYRKLGLRTSEMEKYKTNKEMIYQKFERMKVAKVKIRKLRPQTKLNKFQLMKIFKD